MRLRTVAVLIAMAFVVLPPTLLAAPPDTCPVTEPVSATAPPDPNADPISGFWHISADRKLWAPGYPMSSKGTAVGRYWVRQSGATLTVTARRLDAHAPEMTATEKHDYPTGFYFGSFDVPSEGCWEITATAGESAVTFIAELRYNLERFARQPGTRVVWAKEIGRIENGPTRLVVTAVVLEDPASVTRSARGTRLDLTNGLVSNQLWQDFSGASGSGGAFDGWAVGRLPMVYGLGGYTAVGDRAGLSVVRGEHQYSFPGMDRPAELARLLLEARNALGLHRP